jgi:hypothetical protein
MSDLINFTFEDGSSILFDIKDEALSFSVQAKHLVDDKPKYTSTGVSLTTAQTLELVSWLVKNLTQGE